VNAGAAGDGLNVPADGLKLPLFGVIAAEDGALDGTKGAELIVGLKVGALTLGVSGYQEAATFIFGVKVEAFEFIALKRYRIKKGLTQK
jgi:hypothetical protein